MENHFTINILLISDTLRIFWFVVWIEQKMWNKKKHSTDNQMIAVIEQKINIPDTPDISYIMRFSHTPSRTQLSHLLDEFLCFEESPQIEHLPCGQSQQAAHTEYAEEQYSVGGRFCKRK